MLSFQRTVVNGLVPALFVSLILISVPVAAQHEHGQTHEHGESTGGLDRWLPHLEGDDRSQWQKPDHVVRLMQIEAGMQVVDLGAGTGYFLGPLAEAVGSKGSVLGLDVDKELVEYMNHRARHEGWSNVSARRVKPDDPGLEIGSIDRILIVNTWHHLPDREAYAALLAAALKPGGFIYVVDLTMDSPHGPPKNHRLPAATVEQELEAGGLKTEAVSEDLPYQYVIVGSKPS